MTSAVPWSRKCYLIIVTRRGSNGTTSTSCFYRIGCAECSERAAASGARAFLASCSRSTQVYKRDACEMLEEQYYHASNNILEESIINTISMIRDTLIEFIGPNHVSALGVETNSLTAPRPSYLLLAAQAEAVRAHAFSARTLALGHVRRYRILRHAGIRQVTQATCVRSHTPHAGPAWDPHGTRTALPIL